MPEVIIGFFPDVGGLHPLAQAPGETGTHVALTGEPVGGADAVDLGLAHALVPSDAQDRVRQLLRDRPDASSAEVVDAVGRPEDATSWLAANRSWIDACYAGDDAGRILARLREHPDAAAQGAARTVASRSPFSVAVTLEALRRARSMTLEEVLAQDLRLGTTFAGHPDFAEGVRAQLVDKDRSPRWRHASVDEVPRDEVLAAFGD